MNKDYHNWSQRLIVSDCLDALGYDKLALKVHTNGISDAIISSYIKLIAHTARAKRQPHLIERLCAFGLINGLKE